MRLRCELRAIRLRAELSLRDVASATGIARGDLSRIERGQMLPRGEQVERLETVYGAPAECWYSRRALLELVPDDESRA